MHLIVHETNKFTKERIKSEKKGKDTLKLDEVIFLLMQKVRLIPKYRDHFLTGKYKGCRECHIEPDWLLIYRIDKKNGILKLERTGSHSELFD